MEYIIDPNWKWVDCNLVIKRLPKKDYQDCLYQSLQAEVELISEDLQIKNIQPQIIMQKGFQFQQGKGFIWHKSWYIPQIMVKLSAKVTKMLRQQNQMKKMHCQILSGYPFKKQQHFYLQQIQLQGQTIREFNKKGELSFMNIKFSQTSFNKNKNKFSLILVMYSKMKSQQKSIIKSYISSPVHVDSRKQARKKISASTFIQDQISLSKFQHCLEGAQKLIHQDFTYEDLMTINGFIKYYTAANIRFKLKHPYYIGYHFFSVFDVYYNSDIAKDPVNVLELIYENQIKESEIAKVKSKTRKQICIDNKQILKKSCPKMLIFLIKNTPNFSFQIKQQIEQKPLKQGKLLINQNKSIVHNQKKPSLNENSSIRQNWLQRSDLHALLKPQNEVKQQYIQDEQQIKKQCIITHSMNKQQESIKKMHSIFQSWKFNFIHLKKSDNGLTVLNKRWIQIPRQQLLQSFQLYITKMNERQVNESIKPVEVQNDPNNYLTYDIHQMIVIQTSQLQAKIQENYDR